MSFILVGIAGFIGANIRFIISEKLNKNTSGAFPFGTLSVNLVGGLLLGLLVGAQAGEIYLLLIGIGLLGSLTTFSTLNKELYSLQKHPKLWLIYFLSTYTGGFAVAYVGYLVF
ncbi:CrcB family protein [Psychrobacillus psychrodurans]|uniref:fluoride efflux transporter FluC n=1 Tax=Psychrobacillus TaxID=1221880 RepID=UPI0008E1BF9F|nr:CrcB family protein [Psychrobacillus psychrodurans]MCK1996686.1 CrcB family protein [Psychrobacillus psychrodurans]MCZ8541789.1 CrcB family protein [Psychrobacillus psychrodurans]SFN01468.1 CrcB protein [Psychrobacillus psychrodurans]